MNCRSLYLVRLEGLEPSRAYAHHPLKMACLPFHHNRMEYKWCLRTESNCRHTDFQSVALPTELPRHVFCKKKWRPRSDLNWRSSPWQGDMLTATPRGRVSTLVDYSYILTWATNIMQVLFSNFLMNFSKIYRNMNYTSKIVYINHLYSVYLNILQIKPKFIEIKLAPSIL